MTSITGKDTNLVFKMKRMRLPKAVMVVVGLYLLSAGAVRSETWETTPVQLPGSAAQDVTDNADFALMFTGGNPCPAPPFTLSHGDNCTVEALFNPGEKGLLDTQLPMIRANPWPASR